MPEPTATNPQTGEKVVFRGGQWVPLGGAPTPQPGPVYGAPDPGQANEDTRTAIAVQGEQRQQAASALDNQKTALEIRKLQQDTNPTTKSQQDASRLLTSAGVDLARGIDPVSDLIKGSTSGMLQHGAASAIGAVTGNATSGMENIGKLQTIVSDMTLALTGGSLGNQISNSDRDFIMQRVGNLADPDVPANQRLAAWEQVKQRMANILGVPMAQTVGGSDRQDSDRRAAPLVLTIDGQQVPVFGPDGSPARAGYEGEGFDKNGNSLGLFGRVTDDRPDSAVQAEAARMDDIEGQLGYSALASQGLTLGLTDEASGIGLAIGRALQGDINNFGANYRLGRDTQEYRLNQARERLGGGGTAAELLGGFALPANALAGGVSGAAKGGAIVGGAAGFGYGRGYEQSTQNALLGAGAGAALGYGGQRIGNALANRAAVSDLPQRAASLNAAGQAEGVTVNRAMVDPRLQNRVTGVDATISGGPRVQREMSNIEGQIGSRVESLGAGGRPMNSTTAGQHIETAGKRFIETSGKQAAAKYDRAERMAGNAKVAPKESLAAVDDMISTLSETPGQNNAEIAFLNTLKSDLSQNLSVGALRRMRTALRKRIANGGLTFGEDEARVLGIMDAAANDIRSGLAAQGNERAARAFDAADKAYRARMEYITGTVQKVLGKRNANLPAETVWQRFQSMASGKGDAVGLKRFYATLTPEERSDVAATFAEQLGKNSAGEFSVAQFLTQSGKLSDDAIRTIFGPDGAQSVANLRLLGREVKRVTGAMNSRTSKTGVANNYKDWLINLMLGGIAGGGGAATGGGTAAMAGATVAVGANAARNILSARALMSPRLTKWLARAPATTSPAAIDAHFARLGEIAKAEPALAGEIDAIRRAIMGAANDNVGVSAAASDGKENQQQQ